MSGAGTRRGGRVRRVAVAAVAIVVIAIAIGNVGSGTTEERHRPTARSVLIITLPATTWLDIRAGAPPNLTRLFRTSALANLTTRTIAARTAPGAGYLTLGSGARSVADSATTGLAFNADETYTSLSAAQVYRTETGRALRNGVGALGWQALGAQNQARTFGAQPGALGQALADDGIGRRVIANADGQSVSGRVFHREAALSLVDRSGRVDGQVSDALLQPDERAPFGWRLDPDQVVAAFPRDFSTRRQVVTVEASDLARADTYRPLASTSQRVLMHRRALRDTDALIGRLLARVDLRRDAVVVVAPYHAARARTLTVAAIHGPGLAPGILESATTRRSGYLQIVDVAPTILNLLGRDRPDAMEGRPAEMHRDSARYRSRLDGLVRADRAAQFRDEAIGAATATLVTIVIVLVVAAMGGLLIVRRRWSRVALRVASLMSLGFVVATFLAGLFPTYRWPGAAYVVLIVAISLAFSVACLGLGRRGFADPLILAVGFIIAMHVVDLVTGAHLELNTVFGYGPTVGIRLAGVGNAGSAQLSAAAVLFLMLISWRVPPRGDAWGFAVTIVVLVVIGAPIWGQDYGGALALGPALAFWWLLRSGRRVRVRNVVPLGAVFVLIGLALGFVDLSRPVNERTHVGRFFEKMGTDGPAGFFDVISRKAGLMFGTFSNIALVLLVLIALAGIGIVAHQAQFREAMLRQVPTVAPGLACFAVLVVLGTGLNDSGVQITAIMLATLLPVLVFLATRVGDDTAPPAATARDEPTLARSRA